MMRRTSLRHLALLAALLGAVTGCTTTTRYITSARLHDDHTFFIAYVERTTTRFGGTLSEDSSVHVKMCRIKADNTVTCTPQAVIDKTLADPKLHNLTLPAVAPAPAPDPAPAAPAASGSAATPPAAASPGKATPTKKP